MEAFYEIFISILAPSYFLRGVELISNLRMFHFVSAGGRLEAELSYVEASLGMGAGATNEMIIQTPQHGFTSVLTPDALLTHLEVLKTASKVKIEKNDV